MVSSIGPVEPIRPPPPVNPVGEEHKGRSSTPQGGHPSESTSGTGQGSSASNVAPTVDPQLTQVHGGGGGGHKGGVHSQEVQYVGAPNVRRTWRGQFAHLRTQLQAARQKELDEELKKQERLQKSSQMSKSDKLLRKNEEEEREKEEKQKKKKKEVGET